MIPFNFIIIFILLNVGLEANFKPVRQLTVEHTNYIIPAKRLYFVGTVPIFDFQNLQKSGCPDFLEFQPVNIPVFK